VNIRRSWIVFRKELSSAFRDRNAMFGLLLTPLLSPVLYGLIFTMAADRVRNHSTLVLPVAGAQNAPSLVEWLAQQTDVLIVAAPKDPERAVRERQRDVVLLIGSDFDKRVARGLPAPATIVSDSRRAESAHYAARVQSLIASYGGELAAARLTARGIAPDIADPVALDAIDISTSRERNGGILVFLPMLMMWMALVGGMPLALESTAGERERDSLEPLLSNPISRASVIAGKWLAAAVLGCAGLLLTAASSMLTFRAVPWHELGMQMRVTDADLWSVALVMLPVALLMSSAETLVSALSRSFQQAQTYAGVLMVAAIVPSILTSVLPSANAVWVVALPVLGQLSLTADLLTGQSPAAHQYLLSVLGTALPALVFVALAARTLGRESTIFRGG
jgi:sodium transport system permease protein